MIVSFRQRFLRGLDISRKFTSSSGRRLAACFSRTVHYETAERSCHWMVLSYRRIDTNLSGKKNSVFGASTVCSRLKNSPHSILSTIVLYHSSRITNAKPCPFLTFRFQRPSRAHLSSLCNDFLRWFWHAQFRNYDTPIEYIEDNSYSSILWKCVYISYQWSLVCVTILQAAGTYAERKLYWYLLRWQLISYRLLKLAFPSRKSVHVARILKSVVQRHLAGTEMLEKLTLNSKRVRWEAIMGG